MRAIRHGRVLSAYRDNAAVIEGSAGQRWFPNPSNNEYAYHSEPIDILMKVETHIPYRISPFPGASTGIGRRNSPTRARPVAAENQRPVCADSSVSNLRVAGFHAALGGDRRRDYWSQTGAHRVGVAIMIDGPIGAAAFTMNFGRPNYSGLLSAPSSAYLCKHCARDAAPVQQTHHDCGRPREHPPRSRRKIGRHHRCEDRRARRAAMLIGLGGGGPLRRWAAAASDADLDFASVQRGNPENAGGAPKK